MAANNAENFCMLKSCLLPEELSKAELESETTWATWSALDLPVDDPESLPYPLQFSAALSENVRLDITIPSSSAPPEYAVTGGSRSVQTHLSEDLMTLQKEGLQAEGDGMLAVYTRLQSLLMDIQSEQDDQDQANHSRNNTHKKASIYDIGDPHVAAPRFKRVLLWAHHLLATSKRKDIQAWSSELDVWSLSKTGYPGVIVLEGPSQQVDEFVQRLKSLQWYALQVRHEELVDQQESLVQKQLVAARGNAAQNIKPCMQEFASMGELAAVMKDAGLGEMFATAMKLPST